MEKSLAYSQITIKALNDDAREIVGIASTPEADRDGDIVLPDGAKYKLPMPLLWQHRHNEPIGSIYEIKRVKEGLQIKARLVKPTEDMPSQLFARLDEAWASIKTGLVRGLSIGFRPIEREIIQNTGGLLIKLWDWFETSAVTVPANASGSITSIKSYDKEARDAALGQAASTESVATSSGVSEKSIVKVKLSPNIKEDNPMSFAEKIKQFKETKAAKSAELVKLAEKSANNGETFDAADQEAFDTLTAEIEEIEGHVKRLEVAEKAAIATAKPVDTASNIEKAAATRSTVTTNPVKAHETLEKGIEFARYAQCLVKSKGNPELAFQLAAKHFPNTDRVVKALDFQRQGGNFESIMKATVEAGTTLDATWAAPLVDYQNFAGDFVEYLRPQTILGRFGTGNVPGLRRIPFNVRIAGQTSGGAAYWVGEGAPKPLTAFDFNATELRWAKVASIAVITEELARFSDPSAERLVRDALAAAVIERLDIDFVDPAKAAVANVSPASITNGVTGIPASGTGDADDIRCDLQALWAPFIAANNAPRNAVYIMDSVTALAVSLMQNPLGQPEFPGLTMNGGTLNGVPVIVSDYLPVDTAGHMVILANASDIWLADDGQVTLDASREASLQMLDNPTNNSATGTATSLVSMFQTNSIALRAERYINWAKRRVTAVQYLTGVNWGAC